MARIHPTAIVAASAALADDVTIGAYSIVGADVTIGPQTVVGPHVVIGDRTAIGARNRIFQFASVGEIPQDKKYAGEASRTEIGDDNVIREYVSIHSGTARDRGATTIGNGNWLLAYTHIAHDCVLGNSITFSNNAQIAGHVVIADHVTMGGFSGVHQFGRIGLHALVGAGAIVLQDVPPFTIVQGYPAKPHGTNNEGLRRAGFTNEEIARIKRAYKILYRENLPLEEARTQIAAAALADPLLRPLADFLATAGRGIVR
jgi:UDP-N-acetylglucosamine acyltransferase